MILTLAVAHFTRWKNEEFDFRYPNVGKHPYASANTEGLSVFGCIKEK